MASSCVVPKSVCDDQTPSSSKVFQANAVPKSPWNQNVAKPAPLTSLEDVMSEQLAVELQLSDELEITKTEQLLSNEPDQRAESSAAAEFFVHTDTSNDAVLAQMLQTEMDKEYNQYVTSKEEQVNKNSKIAVSYSNFRTDEMFYSDDDEEEEEDENPITENLDQSSNMLDIKNGKGYVVFGKKLVTKHDMEICSRRNTVRLENSFPTHFRTGDATGMDLQLNNKIFNSLKRHAYSEQKRGQRLHENKQHSTAEHAVDDRTRLIMFRFIDRKIIAAVNGVISIGKEAVILHADGGDIVTAELEPILNETNRDIACTRIPKECAIKVFKTTLNEFKNRDKYIKDDYRFKDRFKKLNPRKVINMWAEKEMHNLVRIGKAGVPCPEVVLLKKHVLVMSFIGENHQAAPKLKNAILSSAQKILAYEQVVEMLKTMYHKCNLVHADFSEYNLLWHDETVWVIDVSQSVEPSHPRALEFLVRDCTNVSKFFKLLGVSNILGPLDLFNEVSGLNIPAEDPTAFLQTIKKLQSASEEHAHQGRNKASQIFEQNVESEEAEDTA